MNIVKNKKINNANTSNNQIINNKCSFKFSNKEKYWYDRMFYSDKKSSLLRNVVVSVASIIIAIVIALIVASLVYRDFSLMYKVPEKFLLLFFQGNEHKLTLALLSVFFLSAISFIFANKAGLFNIGISGQMMFGAQLGFIGSWIIGNNVPAGLGQFVFIVICMAGGMLIALIISLLKEILNIHEVISSIMINWIVFFLGTMMLTKVAAKYEAIDPSGLNTISLAKNYMLSMDGTAGASAYIPLLIIAGIIFIFAYGLLKYLTYGKKISAVGMNIEASRYSGINVHRERIVAMLISGAVAGILGACVYGGYNSQLSVSIATREIPHWGFDGISIGLIGMNSPLGALPVSFLFAIIENAKGNINVTLGINIAFTNLMFGIIVYGAAIISIFSSVTPYLWLKNIFSGAKAGKNYQNYVHEIQKLVDETSTHLFTFKHVHKLLKEQVKLNKKINRYKRKLPQLNNNRISSWEELNEFYFDLFDKFANKKGGILGKNRVQCEKFLAEHWVHRYLYEKYIATLYRLKGIKKSLSNVNNNDYIIKFMKIYGISSINKLTYWRNFRLLKKNIYRYYKLMHLNLRFEYWRQNLLSRENKHETKRFASKLYNHINKDSKITKQMRNIEKQINKHLYEKVKNNYQFHNNFIVFTKKKWLGWLAFMNNKTITEPRNKIVKDWIDGTLKDKMALKINRENAKVQVYLQKNKYVISEYSPHYCQKFIKQKRLLNWTRISMFKEINHKIRYQYKLIQIQAQIDLVNKLCRNFTSVVASKITTRKERS